MGCAIQFSRLGTCPRKQVGALFATNGRIISTGYNGAPSGMPHCNHSCNCDWPAPGDDTRALPHRPGCPADRSCNTAIHAEANAIADAARRGVSLSGSILYVTMAPCLPCAQLLVGVGIVEMHYLEDYRNPDGWHFLLSAGVDSFKVEV